jgi:hypothetical protein
MMARLYLAAEKRQALDGLELFQENFKQEIYDESSVCAYP